MSYRYKARRKYRSGYQPKPKYNQGVKAKTKTGTDMLKSSTFLCNRDRTYLKRIYNNDGLTVDKVPVTTADKLLHLKLIREVFWYTEEDWKLIGKAFNSIKPGEIEGAKLLELKNLIFKKMKDRKMFKITEEGQNALVVSTVSNIKTL